jgi:hypothetical protein
VGTTGFYGTWPLFCFKKAVSQKKFKEGKVAEKENGWMENV